MAKLQHTTPTLGDCIVHDDDSVTVDGVLSPQSVVSVSEGLIRVDVDGNGIINANPVPDLGDITVTRVPGWQGNLGYRVVLEDWAEGETPNAIGMAVYNSPDGNDYSYTTGAMLWDATEEEWYCTCPPGFEPGQENIYMGFLYGSLNVYSFTMEAQWNEQTFVGGGDWTDNGPVDPPPPPPGDTWVDSGHNVTGMAGTVTLTDDNSSFTPGQMVRIEGVEMSITSLWTGTGLTLNPYRASTTGSVIEILQ